MRAVEDWKASPAFDALGQEYVISIKEVVDFVDEKRPELDDESLHQAANEQDAAVAPDVEPSRKVLDDAPAVYPHL